MFLGLRTVIYHVPSLERAKTWYSEVSGVQPYFDEPYYVGFNIGGFELGLDPDTSAVAPGGGGVVAYWSVANLDEALAHVLRLGAVLRAPAQDVGGDIRVATIADPFGNLVGLIQSPQVAASGD